MAQKALNLRVSTPLGQRDDPAHPFEQFIPADDFERVEAVDGRSKHDADEAVDMSAPAVHRQWHDAAPFEPPPEHQIMLPLVRSMLFDLGDQRGIVGPTLADRGKNAVDRRIAAMFIVDVDRSEQVEIALPVPLTHPAS
jgi:hypothetical protein